MTELTAPQIAPWLNFDTLPDVMPRWLIKGLLPAESLICLYGKRGQGKTFLALDWACSIATGRQWLGCDVTYGRVAYLLAERPDGLKRRVRGWLARPQEPASANQNPFIRDDIHTLQFAQHDFFIDVDKGEKGDGNEDLIAFLRKEFPPPEHDEDPAPRRLSLLVIDPLVAFMQGSENETRDMQAFVRGCIRIISELKCSLLLVHHEGKGNVNNILGARGSSALEAGMDTVLYLSPRDKNQIAELRVTKQREDQADPDRYLKFVECRSVDGRKLGAYPIASDEPPAKESKADKKPEPSKATSAAPSIEDEIINAVKTLKGKERTVTRDNILPLISKIKGRSPGVVRNKINQLVANGKLAIAVPHKGTRPTVYCSVETEQDDPSRPAEEAAPIEG